MTRLEQLAALSARVVPVRHVPKAPVPAGVTLVADVAEPADADVMAAAYNSLPELVELARILARIEARRAAGRHTTLASDRKAMAFAFAKFNA
jgi:hypothetical protein